MPNSILALAQEPQINIARAAFEPGYATCLVNTRRFTIRRRGTWLVVRDNLEQKSYAFRLTLDFCRRKNGKVKPRYRLKTRQLLAFHSLWEAMKDAGLFVGNKTAASGKGKLYLDRIVAAVAGLHERKGFKSLSWVRGRCKALNHVVHHIDGDTTNDHVANLTVMLESQHDDLHDLLDLRAAWLVPVAAELKASGEGRAEKGFAAFAWVSNQVSEKVLQPYEELPRPRSGTGPQPSDVHQGSEQDTLSQDKKTLSPPLRLLLLPPGRVSYQVFSRLSGVGIYREKPRILTSTRRAGSHLRGPPKVGLCSGL
jgi:hypothetical protein